MTSAARFHGTEMARPTKATVDYFPHMTKHGKTMYILERKFGNEGYSTWFKTLEILGSSENHFIDCRNTEAWEYLIARLDIDSEKAEQIYNCLADLQGISKSLWKNKIIYSENFVKNVKDAYKRREIELPNLNMIRKLTGTETELMHAETKLMQTETRGNPVNADSNPQSKVKYIKAVKEGVLETPKKEKEKDYKTILSGRGNHLADKYAWPGEDWDTFKRRINTELTEIQRKQN